MSKLYPSIDPEGLVEYSVVYTDRSLNHMSQSFQGVMKNISTTLKQVYNAQGVRWFRAAAPSAWKRWRDSLPPTSNAW